MLIESIKQTMECRYCYVITNTPYAIAEDKCYCSKSCWHAGEIVYMKTRLEDCLRLIADEESIDDFNRIYKTEVILLRALLRGSPIEQLRRIKKILLEQYTHALELAIEEGDHMYLRMANSSKKMLDNYEILIKRYGVLAP